MGFMLKLDSLPSPTSPRSPRSPSFPSPRRLSKPVIAAIIGIVSLIYLCLSHPSATLPYSPIHRFKSSAASSHGAPNSNGSAEFWNQFSTYLATKEPSFPEVRFNNDDPAPWFTYDINEQPPPKRPDRLQLTIDEFHELRTLHNKATSEAKDLATSLPFVAGTRGIVTSAANDALTILATSLRMLRISGSKLPVEVLINEYEETPCQKIFPALGARCIFVHDFLPREMKHPLKYNHFAYKSAAVMFSSFQQILYLDADAFPVENPDSIFTTEPFTSYGFVLWPDYWSHTASHLYYDLADLPVPEMTDRAATESGAMLIDKTTHSRALILNALYNKWGPKFWYRLLSQGATGEGDKETWLAAIRVMRLPFYQIVEAPEHIGYNCPHSERSIASAQHHPRDDWLLTSNQIMRASKGWLKYVAPRVLFIHGNLPKYEAPSVMNWNVPPNWTDQLRCRNDSGVAQAHRMWGPKELTVAKFGWDVEKAIWDSMRWLACNHADSFSMWREGTWHSSPEPDPCGPIAKFYKELLPNEKYDPSIPKGDRKERGWGGISRS
ncbi:MAG: hypothetical protein M1831_005960 [Alyxoria varia]|nr:MAG: hypothetical protein M1831_005960 [Alyxoria varia]